MSARTHSKFNGSDNYWSTKPKYSESTRPQMYSIADSLTYYPLMKKVMDFEALNALDTEDSEEAKKRQEIEHWTRMVKQAAAQEHGGSASHSVDMVLKAGCCPEKIFSIFFKSGVDKCWSSKWGGYWDDILERFAACDIDPDFEVIPSGSFFHVLCRDHPLVVRYWLWRLGPCINIPDMRCRTALDIFILKTTDWITNPLWLENFRELIDYGYRSKDIQATFNRLIKKLRSTRSYNEATEKILWTATGYLKENFQNQKYNSEITRSSLRLMPPMVTELIINFSFGGIKSPSNSPLISSQEETSAFGSNQNKCPNQKAEKIIKVNGALYSWI